MDIVIPLGDGSKIDDLELRFALRSVEKYLDGYSDIYIVGRKPDWLRKVQYIRYTESHSRERNIMEKVVRACASGVSDTFLFMNDDHYLLQPFDIKKFPDYYNDELTPYQGTYGNCIWRTREYLQNKGLPIKNFDIHCPILYNKLLFPQIMGEVSWKQDKVIKSLYANALQRQGVEISDLKINRSMRTVDIHEAIKDRPWFSLGDHGIKHKPMQRILESLYPKPSKYEKVN